MLRFRRLSAFLACLCVAFAARAESDPRPGAQLQASHSGRCLANLGGRPGAAECGPATSLTIEPAPGRDRVLLRHEGSGQCLYANRDGRFGFGGCNVGYEDQQWEWIAPDAASDAALRDSFDGFRLVRSAHAGQCLFSNRDGRFGLTPCTSRYADQFWKVPVQDTAIEAFHSRRCLTPAGATECSSGQEFEFVTAAPGALMLKHKASGQCLYSNKDGRFGWSACVPRYTDQHWASIAPAALAAPEVRFVADGFRQLRALHSGQCLFSNKDGRYGMTPCEPRYADQFWHFAQSGITTDRAPAATLPALPVFAPAPAAPSKEAVNAGPIWSNADAGAKCPVVCGPSRKWTGGWWTTQEGVMSQCECESLAAAPAPTVAPTTAPSTVIDDVLTGAIASIPEAQQKCPIACGAGRTWNGRWWMGPKGSTCQCERRTVATSPAPMPRPMTIPLAPVMVAPVAAPANVDVEAGPIWNDADAARKCPAVCGPQRPWSGQWRTTKAGRMSVCACQTAAAASPVNAVSPVAQPVNAIAPGMPGARQPVSEEDFAAIRSTVASASFSSEKIGALQLATRGRFFTVEQAGDLVDLFSHSDDKIKALQMLKPLLTDPQNSFRLLDRFDFSSDKERARKILAQ